MQMMIFRARGLVALFLFRANGFAKSYYRSALFLSALLEMRLLVL
jgi:hypothetical protein